MENWDPIAIGWEIGPIAIGGKENLLSSFLKSIIAFLINYYKTI